MVTKIRGLIIIASVIASTMAADAWAVNLMDVYKQALSSDAKFKAARSQWLSDRETLAIKRSTLFPQLGAQGSISRGHNAAAGQNSVYTNTSTYSLNLTQPIFNFGNWANIWGAQALAKQAEATFLAAAEDLLLRTATAYFDVLQAKDILYFARANRKSLERTLNQTKHKYDIGLIAITDLENAKADHDYAIAEEIAADNNLSVSFEKLCEITGNRYLAVDSIKKDLPLLSPQPMDIEKWVRAAEQQNFELAASRYAAIVARENIKTQNAGHLPTLDANGVYSYTKAGAVQKNASAGLTLNMPIFQGGAVVAQTRQANYQYQKALADQEAKYRSTSSATRQAFLTVISNISQIKARKQAVKSAASSLRATMAGYEAGTRTMVEVLAEQTNLYNRQKDFTASEYTYIKQFLTLKQLAGILDANDLEQVNSWLDTRTTNNNSTNPTSQRPPAILSTAAADTNTINKLIKIASP